MKLQESVAALRDPRFSWYFGARTVSWVGSVMAPVALAFAVLHVDTSASALALVLGVRTAAQVIFLLLGGVIADRFSRIAVMQIGHVLTLLTQGLAAWLVITGHATIANLTVIEGINGAVSAFTMPAMMGIVPLVVERPLLQQANALLSFSRNTLGVLGPAIAGILVTTVGAGWALAVDAFTYALAVLLLTKVRLAPEERAPRQGMLTELREGWTEFASRQWVWVIVFVFGVINAIGVGIVGVLGPLIAKTTPSLGEAGWGLVLSAEAIGTVVMTVVMLRLRVSRPLLVGQLGAALMAVPMVMLGLAPAVLPMAIAFFVGGLAIEVFGVAWNTALHEHVPTQVLSRVSSYDALGSFVAIPVGTFVTGWLATRHDPSTLAVVGGVAYAVIALLALLSPEVRNLRHAESA